MNYHPKNQLSLAILVMGLLGVVALGQTQKGTPHCDAENGCAFLYCGGTFSANCTPDPATQRGQLCQHGVQSDKPNCSATTVPTCTDQKNASDSYTCTQPDGSDKLLFNRLCP